MNLKHLITCLLLLAFSPCFAQVNIVPMPADIKMGSGEFTVSPATKIIVKEASLVKTGQYLNGYLKKNYGFTLKIEIKGNETDAIILGKEAVATPVNGAYTLNVKEDQVFIDGNDEQGVFYGIQSFVQLLPISKSRTLSIPQLIINDYPRFSYRGMHLDVSRHFFSLDEIKKYLDYLAAYKFNTFHWHLTDDQGWRIEIKKYPLLTQVGGYRNGTIIGRYPGNGNDSLHYGGFYTQEQIKEIVRYAADRFITVIPEIEMPGHASAAIAAYPQLSCFPEENTEVLPNTPWAGSRTGKQVQQTWGVFNDVFAPTDYTFKFLDDVIDEVITLFPSKYIHIGGDECPKENWKRSAFCQQLIKDKNLKDEHGVQSYFIQRMEKYINSKGKKIIGWDEILEGGLAPNATVMSWRGEEGGIAAAKDNHDVIMTPGEWCYFDHSQSKNEDSVTIGGYLPLDKVYNYEPVPAGLSAEQAKYILGAQANLWTEYIGYNKKLEYMVFPRMMALSEVVWTPKDKKDWKSFEKRLPSVFQRLEKESDSYSNAYFDLATSVIEKNGQVNWQLSTNNTSGNIMYSTAKDHSSPTAYNSPIAIEKDMTLSAALVNSKNKLISNWVSQSFHINYATAKKITLAEMPSKSYAGSGAFTLVDGVQNDMGMSKSNEFLGYSGKDLDATIDLGKTVFINEIALHALELNGSWIYKPASVLFYSSADNIHFDLLETVTTSSGSTNLIYSTKKTIHARFVKVVAKNNGIIAAGGEGAGNPAWLFVDEIEVK